MAVDDEVIVPIPPFNYIHVLDRNTNITRMVQGPLAFVRMEHEKIVKKPVPMITLSLRHYCIIENPVKRDSHGGVLFDKIGQVSLSYGDVEYRFFQPAFPLFPGEKLLKEATELTVVPTNNALLLTARLNFTENDIDRVAGDRWLFEGPGVYRPRKEVDVISSRSSFMIKPNSAIRIRALRDFTDRDNKQRIYGEEWLIKKTGAYMLGAFEELVTEVTAYILNENLALRVKALRTHVDELGKLRKHGEEWLITHLDTESHIPSIDEEVVSEVNATVLSSNNYCIIRNPVDEKGVPRFGHKVLLRGEKVFFLMPGEELENVLKSYILKESDGLILCALVPFMDGDVKRVAGEEWLIRGPMEFIPPIEVSVKDERKAIPLDDNEGIYVRDKRTGKIRSVIGTTHMLNQNEHLWEKKLPTSVEQIILSERDPLGERDSRSSGGQSVVRDPTRVVTYRVPHNAAVQVYDYIGHSSRIIFGPNLVMLGPDEQFTLLSLSGGKPKRPNVIKAICLLLGPDYCTDVLIVETSDHARLSIQLSYNWHFDVPTKNSTEDSVKLFAVPDFVGDFCNAIASRIRGAVASTPFDRFHKNSAAIIRQSVFGVDESGKMQPRLVFPQNNLVITSVDVQSVEPVDQRTRDSLQKSVQLAIEITSSSQEASARHEAERLDQESRGRLERQRINDEAIAEEGRRKLLELQIASAALETSGQAKAEAQSHADAALIENQSAVTQAKLKADALKIESAAEVERLSHSRDVDLAYQERKNALILERKRMEVDLDVSRYQKMVEALGSDNLRLIACAGADRDVRMLRALNLKTALITDGHSPINLLDATSGLIGQSVSSFQRLPETTRDIILPTSECQDEEEEE